MNKYRIMKISSGYDNKVGEIVIVKANPVQEFMGYATVNDMIGRETETFHLPKKEEVFNPIIRLAQNQQIWCPDDSEFEECELLDEDNGKMVKVYRHISIVRLIQNKELLHDVIEYHALEISFNNGDFEEFEEEIWELSASCLMCKHGLLDFESFMEVEQGALVGIQIGTDGYFDFSDFPNGPDGEVYITTIAIMRQPHNAWLWIYMFDENHNPVAQICGFDELDGFAKLVKNMKAQVL